MRKVFYWGALLLAALSCTRQEAVPAGQAVNFRASLAPTRVAIAQDGKTAWESGDAISVFGASGINYRLGTLGSGEVTDFDQYSDSIEAGLVASQPYALYPWAADNACSGSVLTAPLAVEQYGVPDSFPANQEPVFAARGDAGGKLYFAHATALLRFTLVSEGISSVSIRPGGSSTAALAGTLSLSMDGNSVSSVSASGSQELVLKKADGSALAPGTYYLVSAPASLPEGIVMSWTHADGRPAQSRTGSSAALLRAGRILQLGTVQDAAESPISIVMTSAPEATVGVPYTLGVTFSDTAGSLQKAWPKVVAHKNWTVFPAEMAANWNGWWPEVSGSRTEAQISLTFTEAGEYEVMVYGPLTDGTHTFDPEGTDGLLLGTIAVSAGESGGTDVVRTGLADGFYDISFTASRSLSGGVVYVEAQSGTLPARRTSLCYGSEQQHVIRGVQVSGGSCRVRTVEAASPATYSLSSFTFTPSSAFTLLQGGDISRLNMMLDHGVVYREDGSVKDAVDIAADNGWNLVRLRVFNDPGNLAYYPSSCMTKGYVNAQDALKLAAKAHAKGLQILLSFHYSDYWTDALHQNVPHEWTSYNESQLLQAVYDFTADVLSRMMQQGTQPAFVSVGNETNSGMLFGGGTDGKNTNAAYMRQYDKFVAFFNQGAAAVRGICPGPKVVVHAANPTKGIGWFFNHLANYGADYDIIGLSYYPFWSGATVAEFVSVAEGFAASYGRDVLIMETGFNWNTVTYYGDAGQLADQGPYESLYPASPENQRNFLQELSVGVKNARHILGYLYWDPLTCPLKTWSGMDHDENGYSVPNHDNGTVTQNSSLFDFNGNRLPAWDAFRYNN